MTAVQRAAIIAQITAVFQAHGPAPATLAIQPIKGIGKLYELWVLAHLVGLLVGRGLRVRIANGNSIRFRQSPGSIDRTRSWFEVSDASQRVVGEIMLDVEFETISFAGRLTQSIAPNFLTQGDCHELDIALIEPGLLTQTRPNYGDVMLAVECKHTSMNKGFIRNVLGLRRELSFLHPPRVANPILGAWPLRVDSNHPPSALLLFCNDPKVRNYRSITHTFDISLCYLPM